MKACSYRKEKTITLSVFVLLSSLLFTGIAAAETPQPNDRKIEQAVRDALGRNTELTLIDVNVSNRDVALSGEVDHYQDEVDAEAAARSVPGVRSVHSTISVTTPEMNDGDLQKSLEDRIHFARADMGLTFPDVQVNVHDGVVALSGHVSGQVEHAIVLALAGTADGVRGIQDRLQIMGTEPDDDAVRTEVNKTIYGDSLVNAADSYSPVQALFRDGVVTLMGEVDTTQQETDLVTRIRAIHGVICVNDELAVRDRQPVMKPATLDIPEVNCTKH